MAPPRLPSRLVSLVLITQLASALQVTPNSPCASICQDRSDVDLSDPNSSNTRNSDIVCGDVDHGGEKGSKWKDCMTCMQNSTFVQGSESDQMWFMCKSRRVLAKPLSD